MSTVTNEDIKKASHLARIEVLEIEREKLAQQVSGIISWVEKLNEVNTDNVLPLINVSNNFLTLNKDEVLETNLSQDVLKNAKNAKYGYFAVPKVIE